MDNDLALHGSGLNLQGNQYKLMIEKHFDHFCDILYVEQHKSFFERYQNHTKYPVAWKTCPYPEGENEVFNFLVEDTGNLLPPYVPGNEKWKAEARFFREGKVLGGYNIYGILRTMSTLVNGK
jgi:hypothetical protein